MASIDQRAVGAFHSERDAAVAREERLVELGRSRRPEVDEATRSAFIPLTQGKRAIVDLTDLPIVTPFLWSANRKRPGLFYAVASGIRSGGPRTQIIMHRVLMPEVDESLLVDHRNGDGLDNRKCNLRAATTTQNLRNRRSVPGSSSRYLGVSKGKKEGLWDAAIRIGTFASEEEAARAYDRVAHLLDPEFRRLNFPSAENQ